MSAARRATSCLCFCHLWSTAVTLSHLLLSSPLICRYHLSSPLVYHRCSMISWLIVKSDHWSSPLICCLAGHLLLPLSSPLIHRLCPFSSVITTPLFFLFATVAISHGWWSLSRCYPHVSAGYWHNGGTTASGSYGCDVGCCWLLEA